MKASLFALAAGASTVLAATKGFNYASQGQNQQGYETQFTQAQALKGANGFNSARLYTMIEDGTTDTPITAIQAAIDTKTSLLLGLWASQAQDGFDHEITALKASITKYGTDFTDLVVGISVGSEDLYRISSTGIANKAGVGQSPDTLVSYISQTRDAIKGTSLGSKPVGHVDTWNVFVNGTNSPVIAAADFLGLDEYPYFQTTDPNAINNGSYLFFQAYDRVKDVAQGKPIWITESGWPVSGPTSGAAVASVSNAELYWQEVMCELENKGINTWWYILADQGASPSFGVSDGNGNPLYNLACNSTAGFDAFAASQSSSSSSGSSSATSTSSGSSASGGSSTATTTGSGSSSGSVTPTSSGSASGAAGAGSHSGSGSAGTASKTSGAAVASSSFPGAASKVDGSVFSLVLAAFAAFIVL